MTRKLAAANSTLIKGVDSDKGYLVPVRDVSGSTQHAIAVFVKDVIQAYRAMYSVIVLRT